MIVVRKQAHLLIVLLVSLLLGGLLVACGQREETGAGSIGGPESGEAVTGTPTAVPPPSVTPRPTETLVLFTDVETGLTIRLPESWIVGPRQLTVLGWQRLLGPEPLGPGPASSSILVADASELTAPQAAALLHCGDDCPDETQIALEATTITGRPAQRAVIGAETTVALEWFFVEWEGQLVYFSIHDPETLATRTDLLETLDFVIITPTPTPTQPPTATATNTPTPLPPTATDTVTPSPVPTEPPTPLSVSLDFLQALYDDPDSLESLSYLSQSLRARTFNGRAAFALLAVERPYWSFQVMWGTEGEDDVVMLATLNFNDGSSVGRYIHLVNENAGWYINAITPGP